MPKELHLDLFRPSDQPSPDIPFGVRSVCRYRHPPPFKSGRKILTHMQMFWCAAGSGIVVVNGRDRVLRRNHVAICFPGMLHYYYAHRGMWDIYCWTLDGVLAAHIATAFGMDASIRMIGPPPARLFAELMRAVPRPTRRDELHANLAAYRLLTCMAHKHWEHTDEVADTAIEFLNRNWHDPEISMNKLAMDLAVSPATLSTRIEQKTGVPPVVYLKRLRIQHALLLLHSSRLAIKEIAFQCGYKDANYFARIVHKVTGKPPAKLRPD